MKIRNLIQQADYTLLVPRTGVKPLDLIWKKEGNLFDFLRPTEGNLVNASLQDVFTPTQGQVAYPKIQKVTLPQQLGGKDVLEVKSSFVASFLQDNEASVKLSNSNTVLFSYEDNVSTVVDWTKVEDYLQATTPKTSQVERLQKGQVYIILAVLASKKLSIAPTSNFDFSSEITTTQLAEYLAKLQTEAGISHKKESIIKQEGDKYLVFAIQTAKILYKNGKYSLLPKAIIVRNGTDDKPEFETLEGEINITD